MPTGKLLIGWECDETNQPTAWHGDNRPDLTKVNSIAGLRAIDARKLATHAVLIAQSGSGKSFFLGRLIEEIIIRTRSRVVVLDPNGDFRVAWEPVAKEQWVNPNYHVEKECNWLPTEACQDVFLEEWKKHTIQVCSLRKLPADRSADKLHRVENIAIPWRHVPGEMIEGETWGGQYAIGMCHRGLTLVRDLVKKAEDDKGAKASSREQVFSHAVELFTRYGKLDREKFAKALGETLFGNVNKAVVFQHEDGKALLEDPAGEDLYRLLQVVDASSFQRYASIAMEYIDSGVFCLADSDPSKDVKLQVIDLASIPNQRVRLAVVSGILRSIWERAKREWTDAMNNPAEQDRRVPTFIVVDEAHHLASAQAEGRRRKILVEQFREMAAEGRKFGVFLIIVSQRPDRLDTMVTGECSNVGIMRLDNAQAISSVVGTLRVDASVKDDLEKARGFPIGRAMLFGEWAQGKSGVFYTAARRTREGGRNLRSEWWAEQPA